jgi:hypothetical protein
MIAGETSFQTDNHHHCSKQLLRQELLAGGLQRINRNKEKSRQAHVIA